MPMSKQEIDEKLVELYEVSQLICKLQREIKVLEEKKTELALAHQVMSRLTEEEPYVFLLCCTLPPPPLVSIFGFNSCYNNTKNRPYLPNAIQSLVSPGT